MNRTAGRRERLAQSLSADGVDALLVTSVTNVGYLSGFTGDASAMLLAGDRALVLSDGRYETQLQDECPDLEIHIRPVGQLMPEGIAAVVGGLGLRRVAFEASALTVADFEEIKAKLPGVEFVPVKERVEALRAVKDEDEVAAIREAIGQAERAFALLRAAIRSFATEKDAADTLEGNLRRSGATAASFPPIVAAGSRSALPHARPTAARIDGAAFVLVDWGADGGPYKSDLTRVLVTGKVTREFEEVYRIVLEAQERGIAAIRPGVKASAIDAVARSVIEEAGYGVHFPHGLGHGLGRDIHESPWLRRGADVALRPGMVVTVEPGIYLPGRCGIRIEDDVLVTPDGSEVLTHLPRSLESARV